MFHTRKGWGNPKFIQFYFEHQEEILVHDDLEVLGQNDKAINKKKEMEKKFFNF